MGVSKPNAKILLRTIRAPTYGYSYKDAVIINSINGIDTLFWLKTENI